jgi:hypothetical protein
VMAAPMPLAPPVTTARKPSIAYTPNAS